MMNIFWFQIVIAIAVLAIALSTLLTSFMLQSETVPAFIADFFVNFGSELLGMFVTVGILNVLLVLREQKLRIKQIASKFLIELHHAMWLWQGGKRELEVDELIAKIYHLDQDSPITKTTLKAFNNLSLKAHKTLLLENRLLKKHNRLPRTLKVFKHMPLVYHNSHACNIDANYCNAVNHNITPEEFLKEKIELCHRVINLVELSDLPDEVITTLEEKLRYTVKHSHLKIKNGDTFDDELYWIAQPSIDDSKEAQKERNYGEVIYFEETFST